MQSLSGYPELQIPRAFWELEEKYFLSKLTTNMINYYHKRDSGLYYHKRESRPCPNRQSHSYCPAWWFRKRGGTGGLGKVICSAKLFQGFVLSDPSSKSCICVAVDLAVSRRKGIWLRGEVTILVVLWEHLEWVHSFVLCVCVWSVALCCVCSAALACWRASSCFEHKSMLSTYQW